MSLLKNGSVLFLTSMAGNFCNYLFQFFMSRNLELTDYGALNAALSITSILGIPAGTVMVVVARYASTFNAMGEGARVSRLYRNSLLFTLGAGIVVFLLLSAASGPLAAYLQLQNGIPIIIAGFGLVVSFTMTVNMGMLQGLQKFWHFGAGIWAGAASKLAMGVAFVFLGFGLNGAVAAAAFPGLFVIAMTFLPLASVLRQRPGGERVTLDIASYSVPVLISSLAFTAMLNIDLLTVKHWASPEDAGLYSAAAVLGKTILYLPAAFVMALFPMLTDSHARKRDMRSVLDRGLLVTFAVSMAGVLVLAVIPEFSITLLFGAKFAGAAPLLKYYGIAMMSLAMVSVLVSYNLARGKSSFIYSLLAGGAAHALLLNVFKGSLVVTVIILAAVNMLVAAYNLIMVLRERRVESGLRQTAEGVIS
ncbi:MAG: oligosaccharide flippase family protein [Deltaproteobacteria bacterium]|nr:oligosaccharide flippase family protein [Deltaproteobacteria bacterium]MBZ0219482.1 oligosaccharide flippase family protein [Deltaproteobacteria bacterium]